MSEKTVVYMSNLHMMPLVNQTHKNDIETKSNDCQMNFITEEDIESFRTKRRREQNKIAAASYRQRRKSFLNSCLHEYEQLQKKNLVLKANIAKLDKQILAIRELITGLNTSVPSGSCSKSVDDEPEYEYKSALSEHDYPAVRANPQSTSRFRRHTWSSNDLLQRKMEQNKVVARKFRKKKKFADDSCQKIAYDLEQKNISLKTKASELERKIELVKSLMKEMAS